MSLRFRFGCGLLVPNHFAAVDAGDEHYDERDHTEGQRADHVLSLLRDFLAVIICGQALRNRAVVSITHVRIVEASFVGVLVGQAIVLFSCRQERLG